MRSLLLPLLGAVLSVSSLYADSISTTSDLYGKVVGHCTGTDYCLVGNLQNGPYSEAEISRTVNGNSITYVVSMNFSFAGEDYAQGDVIGTIDVPSSWDWVKVNTYYQQSSYGVSPTFFLAANFDPTHTRIPQGNGIYTLDPTVENKIQLTGDAEGVSNGPCGQWFCAPASPSWLQYTISLTGPTAPNDPAPTPEPATSGLLALSLAGLFLARRRFASAHRS